MNEMRRLISLMESSTSDTFDREQVSKKLITLGESLLRIKNDIKLNESLTLDSEIGNMLQTATTRFFAAKKGLGLANQLKDPDEKSKHQQRVMRNMNALRALVKKIESML